MRKHFLERAVHGMHHAQPPWFYLTTLPVDLMPWTGLVIGGLVLAWRERRSPEERFLLVWSATVVPVYAILDAGSLSALPAATRGRLRVLSTTRMSDAEILFVRSAPPPPGR